MSEISYQKTLTKKINHRIQRQCAEWEKYFETLSNKNLQETDKPTKEKNSMCSRPKQTFQNKICKWMVDT